MSNIKGGRGEKTAARWLGATEAAHRGEQERADDAKFYRREKVGDRVKKLGIKVGAKFSGYVGNDSKRARDTYTVSSIDTVKNVVILKGKTDPKTRRVSVLNKIFE
ncbi:MAG: hypothetical protein Q7S66_00860 [bacterium]|nr:hypothetical protein [bacterium]